MSLVVEVYDGDDVWPGSPILRTLTQDDGRSLRIALGDTGSWSLTVPRGSTDAAALLPYRWVKFRLDGDVVMAGRIAPWDQTTIASGEEAAEELTVDGLGALALLRDAIVFPHPSTGRLARDSRFFNFASPDYDYSAWGAAVELYEQGDPATSLYGIDLPESWPDGSAVWIWGTAINLLASPPHDVGDCYFRASVTLAAEGDRALFITADDGYELWVDGVMLAAQTEAFIFRQTYRIDQFLDAGVHEVAIKGTNMDRPSSPTTNAAGVLFAMYSTTNGGELSVLELHSDDTWKCVAYPAQPPGFTPGRIMEILTQEAHDRGALWVLDLSFDGDLDSNGDAWDGEVDVSFRFSDTYLDVVAKLGESFVDYAADQDNVELDMTNKGAFGSVTGVELEEGTHFGQGGLRHSADPSKATDLLMRDSEGNLTEVSSGVADDPPDGGNPRIESYLEAGSAGSASAAERMAEGVFDSIGASRVLVTAGVEAIAGATPLADFSIGDTVDMPDRFGAATATVIESITVSDVSADADGELAGSVAYSIEGWQDA